MKFLCPKRSIAAVTFLYSSYFLVNHSFGAAPKPITRTVAAKSLSAKNTSYLNNIIKVRLNISGKRTTPVINKLSSTQTNTSVGAASQETQETTLNFAEQNIHTSSAAQTFTIRGSNLTADVTVSTNPPFSLSKDSIIYEQLLTYSVTELASNRTVYVKFKPTATGNYTDSITNVSEGAENKIVALTGTAIAAHRMTYGKRLDANNIITPNGDGMNDTWVIKNIENYPNNTVKVMNKSGNVVYSKQGYTNDWNGTYNDGPLAQGTYYYIVDFGADSGLLFRGFITIVRD